MVYVCSVAKGQGDAPRTQVIGHLVESLTLVSDYAAARGLALAIEHFPTGVIPRARDAIELIESAKLDELGLLLDTGHLAIAGEGLEETFRLASEKVIHVHLNNNDGSKDLHWPPQDGILTESDFRGLVSAMRGSDYDGPVSVEMVNPDPLIETIDLSLAFVRKLLAS
jgi:fructoselysine 3-epimerase